MATQPKKIFGIHTYTKESTPATAPNTSEILSKNSIFYGVLGGVFFFLVSYTHLYYNVFITIFSIIFFLVYIFKEKDVKNNSFIKNFLIIIGIGIISTLLLITPNILSDIDFHDRSITEHKYY